MALFILAILNIPLFLFIGWVAFDSRENAADTFWETLVALLQQLFVPPLVRIMLGMDTSGAIGAIPLAAFFIACGGLVFGEAWLIESYLGWRMLPA